MKSDIQIKNVFPGTLVLPVQSYPCYRKYTRGKMYKNIRIRLTYELHSKNPIFIYNIILLQSWVIVNMNLLSGNTFFINISYGIKFFFFTYDISQQIPSVLDFTKGCYEILLKRGPALPDFCLVSALPAFVVIWDNKK